MSESKMFKIVVIGSTGTGKTNISSRFINNQFNEGQKATVGVQFLEKNMNVQNENIKVTVWDTAGQERYRSLNKNYYKGASGVLVVYDVTNPQSFIDVQSWIRLANESINLDEVVLMIAGNKIDLEEERSVPTSRAISDYNDKFGIDCWEVSAKTGTNVQQIFASMLNKIYQLDNDSSEPAESLPNGSIIPQDQPEIQHIDRKSKNQILQRPQHTNTILQPPTKQKKKKSCC